ncbi:hypothetical protein TIFTF001_032982 [Ficus carica]|uniref:Reverse transcriptase zinc-binding domain-containing protein n=1 Tax=Ficus carica TaxID=3494 RepID=A0AA88J6I7_FICCA|nr:hypothetical protein TIFTF001_032982 [Ficus carica]
MDSEAILSIHLGSSNCLDNLIWHYNSRGPYTVLSRYLVVMEAKGLEGSSNAAVSKAWWGKLWSLKLPSKVKIFLWQAFHGVLPYFAILNRRGVKCLNECTQCCKGVESVWHSLWECPSAREVWDSFVLWPKLRCSLAVSFAGLCLGLFEKGSRE